MKNKNIYVVRSCFWKVQVEVEDFYIDQHAEACTRAIELFINDPNINKLDIGPVLLCKRIDENYEKTYNSCKILQNAGFYKEAASVRDQFFQESIIDLYNESLSSK